MDASPVRQMRFLLRQLPPLLERSCTGCLGFHQPGDCYTRDCVLKQGISACGMCGRFPCDVIPEKERYTVLDKAWLQWKKQPSQKTKQPEKECQSCPL